MSLMNLLRGVGDQLDFIPGFDPVKDKQGLMSQILSGAGQRMGGGMNPGGMPPIVPQGQPSTGRPLPGGAAMMPAQGAPMAMPKFKSSVNPLEEFFLPKSFTDDRKFNDTAKYSAEVAKFEATQAAQAAAAQRQAITSEGIQFGLSGKDLLAYVTNPEEFTKRLAERQGVMSAGQSFQDGGQFTQAPSPFTPETMGNGQIGAFNPNTGVLGDAQGIAKPEDLPEGMVMGDDGVARYMPEYVETQERLRRAGASSVNVNAAGEKGENKFQEGLGSQAATNFGTIIEQGRAATASIGNLDTMEALLDSIDYTGFGGDTLLNVQRAGAMLGFEIPDLPAKEAAKRLSSQMALSLKSDLPGPMSNADREFLLSIPPNLNSTAAGNDAILFILRKREERKQDMMQSVLQANPTSMEEYRAWENRYLQETPPMFTPKTQASLLKALGGASGEDSPQ
jgi:hypothetical protein